MGDLRLSWLQRIQLRLSGYVYIEHRTRPGWRGYLPFFAFKCEKHGLVVNYKMGEDEYLICPLCIEEDKSSRAAHVI